MDSTWEDHSTAITGLEEYQELADEELAKEVFDKYIQRLKVRFACHQQDLSILPPLNFITGKVGKEAS